MLHTYVMRADWTGLRDLVDAVYGTRADKTAVVWVMQLQLNLRRRIGNF